MHPKQVVATGRHGNVRKAEDYLEVFPVLKDSWPLSSNNQEQACMKPTLLTLGEALTATALQEPSLGLSGAGRTLPASW